MADGTCAVEAICLQVDTTDGVPLTQINYPGVLARDRLGTVIGVYFHEC